MLEIDILHRIFWVTVFPEFLCILERNCRLQLAVKEAKLRLHTGFTLFPL